MRILQMIADGNPGGGTTHVLQILRRLRNWHSFGLVTQLHSYLFQEAQSLGIPCFGVNFLRSRFDPLTPIKLRKVIQRFNPDIAHAHGSRIGFFLALTKTKIPAVYTIHGFHFIHKPALMRRFAAVGERIAIQYAQCAVFVSHHDYRLAETYRLISDNHQRVVIPNSVPSDIYGLKQRESVPRIGFVGRLEFQKDPLLFLDIVERLPGYSATIVGGGSLENKVKDAIARRRLGDTVRLTGTLAHAETLHALAGMEVVVMTSRWEGFPILPLEAMALGVPVVSAAVGGLSEIIENGKSGVLVQNRSAGEFVQAIIRIMRDKAFRQSLVEHARERVNRLFSEDRMVSRIQRVYETVIAPYNGVGR